MWPAGWRADATLESAQAQLFEPFSRLCRAQSVIPGSGLELVLKRWFIDEMCGRIEVRSRRGEGRVFSVALPVA